MDAHIRIELDVDELVSQLFQTVFRVDNTSTAVMTIADVSATTTLIGSRIFVPRMSGKRTNSGREGRA